MNNESQNSPIKKSKNGWKSYWPLGIVVALVLIGWYLAAGSSLFDSQAAGPRDEATRTSSSTTSSREPGPGGSSLVPASTTADTASHSIDETTRSSSGTAGGGRFHLGNGTDSYREADVISTEYDFAIHDMTSLEARWRPKIDRHFAILSGRDHTGTVNTGVHSVIINMGRLADGEQSATLHALPVPNKAACTRPAFNTLYPGGENFVGGPGLPNDAPGYRIIVADDREAVYLPARTRGSYCIMGRVYLRRPGTSNTYAEVARRIFYLNSPRITSRQYADIGWVERRMTALGLFKDGTPSLPGPTDSIVKNHLLTGLQMHDRHQKNGTLFVRFSDFSGHPVISNPTTGARIGHVEFNKLEVYDANEGHNDCVGSLRGKVDVNNVTWLSPHHRNRMRDSDDLIGGFTNKKDMLDGLLLQYRNGIEGRFEYPGIDIPLTGDDAGKRLCFMVTMDYVGYVNGETRRTKDSVIRQFVLRFVMDRDITCPQIIGDRVLGPYSCHPQRNKGFDRDY